MKKTITIAATTAIVWMLGLALAPCEGAASDIAVHLINARTGRPIHDKPVRMWSTNPPTLWLGHLEEKTDHDGTAIFHLKEPLPKMVMVHTGMGGYWEECFPQEGPYLLDEILTSGVSKMGACLFNIPNIDEKFQPKPGDLYFFVVHLSFWEHLTHCSEWGCHERTGTSLNSNALQPPAGAAGPSPHEITIRVVNGETGNPMARKRIGVCPPHPSGRPYGQVILETNAGGAAVFRLDDPPPRELIVFVDGSKSCSPDVVEVDRVLQEGVVGQNQSDRSGKVRAQFAPKTGELIVFVRLSRL